MNNKVVPVAASGIVINNPNTYLGSVVLTSGSDAATLTLYDNASSAAGTALLKLAVPAANTSVTVNFKGVGFVNGVYASLTGTSAQAFVELM